MPAAAKALGMTPEGAYQLRRQPGAAEFAAAWQAALAKAQSGTPPPSLPPVSMQELMLILRAATRRREADSGN